MDIRFENDYIYTGNVRITGWKTRHTTALYTLLKKGFRSVGLDDAKFFVNGSSVTMTTDEVLEFLKKNQTNLIIKKETIIKEEEPVMSDNYSPKEKELIAKMGMTDILESKFLVPPVVYQMMAMKCFMDNRSDEVADSVRRCLIALSNHNVSNNNPIYRLTQEFDNLIQF